jgi:hypothetical protein
MRLFPSIVGKLGHSKLKSSILASVVYTAPAVNKVVGRSQDLSSSNANESSGACFALQLRQLTQVVNAHLESYLAEDGHQN